MATLLISDRHTSSQPLVEPTTRPRLHRVWPRLTPGGAIGLTILVSILAIALLGSLDSSLDPDRQALRDRLAPPVLFGGEWSHPLGTDQLGRDLWARTVAGARVSLEIGLLATLAAGLVGVSLGVAAGYLGGRTDRLVTFLSDVQLALPFVVVAIGIVAMLGNSTRNVILTLAITGWVGYARVVRLQALSLRSADFVEAARASGATQFRIMRRHVAPNLAVPIVVLASQQIAAMILYEAALSYLGLGVSGGTITWGGMVANGREQLLTAWWVSTVPGIAIALLILGLHLSGDWLAMRLSAMR